MYISTDCMIILLFWKWIMFLQIVLESNQLWISIFLVHDYIISCIKKFCSVLCYFYLIYLVALSISGVLGRKSISQPCPTSFISLP